MKKTFLTVCHEGSYGVTIQPARWLTADEKTRYNPEAADRIMVPDYV